MGNSQVKNPKFEEAKRQFSDAGLLGLQKTFLTMASQCNEDNKSVTAPVFQSFYGIQGCIGNSLFKFITNCNGNGTMSFEDYVVAKAKYEKASPSEIEEYTFSILELQGSGKITRNDVKSVLLSVFSTVLDDSSVVPDTSLNAFLSAATFSGPEGSMTVEDYRKWCSLIPGIKKFMGSLMTEPHLLPAGRSVPHLNAPPELMPKCLLRAEYSWHLGGMLQDSYLKQWNLLFHSSAHGFSFNTFMGRVSTTAGPTILVVRDKGGSVFGGFATHTWTRHSEFYGDMKSFLFTLNPSTTVYRPSGANTNIQWCASNFTSESIPNGIGFGGQVGYFAVFLDASFEQGHSRASVTFNNSGLASTPTFEPDTVECWEIEIPVPLEQGIKVENGPKGTILERFKEDKAVLNLVGIANESENTSN